MALISAYDKLQVRKITGMAVIANNTGMIKAFLNNGFKIEGVLKNQLKYKNKYVDPYSIWVLSRRFCGKRIADSHSGNAASVQFEAKA